MKELTLIIVIALTITGCDFVNARAEDPGVEECHNSVESQAKYDVRIITTDPIGKTIGGRAELQNGFGAWRKYEYLCMVDDDGHLAFSAKLLEGWSEEGP